MYVVDYVDVFEPFLKAYVDEFKYESVTTGDWKQFLYKFFDDKVISATFSHVLCSFIAVGNRRLEYFGTRNVHVTVILFSRV